MPGWPEISSSVYGAYRLARLDAGGLHYFNLSVEGFWHSFFAAILVAPAYIALVLVRRQSEGEGEGEAFSVLLPEILAYALGWIIWPLVMFVVAHFFRYGANFVTYIVVYNWASVIQMIVLLPLAVLTQGGVLPEQIAPVIGVMATVYVLFYLWFVARTALGAREWNAAAIVALDVSIGLMLSTGIAKLFA